MSTMYIDCRVAMYQEEAVRVLAVLDTQNETLTLTNVMPYMPSKNVFEGKSSEQIQQIKEIQRNTILVVDNPEAFPNWDQVFIEQDHLDEAVRAFFLLKNKKSLILKNDVQTKYSPDHVVQVRKMDMRGNQYEFDSSSTTNGHVAVLLCCWAALKMNNVSSVYSEEEKLLEDHLDDEDDFLTPFTI